MGLLSTTVLVTGNWHNIKHYRERGYKCNKGDKIIVKVEDLTAGSSAIIKLKCDYCGKEYEMKFYEKSKVILNKEKICCGDYHCQYMKRRDYYNDKYGVDNPMKVETIREKSKNTCIKKYGEDNPAKVEMFKEKIKATNLEKYGSDNPMGNDKIKKKMIDTCIERYGVAYPICNENIKNKIKNTLMEKYGVESPFLIDYVKEKLEQTGISGSKIQNYICEVYNGVSSVKVGCYLVDMIIDNNIVCEVDGGGHTLKIKFKKETEEDFYKKEYGREKYLISKGYKIFRIITNKNKLPDKDFLLYIKNQSIKYFDNGYNVFRFYIDNNTFRYY